MLKRSREVAAARRGANRLESGPCRCPLVFARRKALSPEQERKQRTNEVQTLGRVRMVHACLQPATTETHTHRQDKITDRGNVCRIIPAISSSCSTSDTPRVGGASELERELYGRDSTDKTSRPPWLWSSEVGGHRLSTVEGGI